MKTPFVKVSIRNTNNPADDRDISDCISEFSYEDATDTDNMLTLEIKHRAKEFLDDPVFAEGAYISFQWGYLDGKTSQKFIQRVANISTDYENIISMSIQATDLGILLKKRESKKNWSGMKGSDIARQIANIYGLRAVIDDTDTVHAFMPQGGKTDYNFLKYLSKLQKTGSWRFFVKNDVLYFTRLKLDQPSFKSYEYNNGDGVVLSFKPYSRETAKSNAARNTVVTTIDPFTNKPVQKAINDSTAKDDVKLGDYPAHIYNGDGKQISGPDKTNKQKRPSQIQTAQQDTNAAGSHIFNPSDEDDSENIGNWEKKNQALKEYMADMETEGEPDVLSDLVITMNNVSKRDIGNWFITRAKHAIVPGAGYKTFITMHKNATQKAGAQDNNVKEKNTNQTAGTNDPDTKKTLGVYTYDSNGKQLSGPAQ